jgi:hypothetical protein
MTKQNQLLQTSNSQTYDDTLNVPNAEISSTNLESDLNFIRSQLKQITGELDWFALPSSSIRDLALSTGITKLFTYYRTEFPTVLIPNTKTYAQLSLVNQPPSINLALDSNAIGAIAAELLTISGVNHSLITSPNRTNLVLVRDHSTLKAITDSNGNTVYGLLQVEIGSINGNPFALSGINSAQISLVIINKSTGNLEEADVFAVQNKTIQYSYQKRESFTNLEEDAFNQANTFLMG